MSPHPTHPDSPALPPDAVCYTLNSLVRHMAQCQQAQGRMFGIHAKAELAHTIFSTRIVTCSALAVLCCWALMSLA